MLIIKIIENKKMYNMQELCLDFVELILTKLVSSTISLHSSTNLSTCLFYTCNFYYPNTQQTSHDLSQSHSQLLGFQIYLLSHKPLSINFLHSHQHLSPFQGCLLLEALASNLYLHLHVSFHFMCLVLLVLDIRLNTLGFL